MTRSYLRENPGRTDIVVFSDVVNSPMQIGMIVSVLPNAFTEINNFFPFLDGPTGIKTVRRAN